MAEAGIRVVLLARAGKARDQLHRALNDVGALIVAEGDPAELDPAQVAAQTPNVFLVSLEPAIEAALDRFDELLAAPDVEVMFDDAEVTAKLDGWDLNRWARHVASKLFGNEGLPRAPGGSPSLPDVDVQLQPGAPPTPAELMEGARLEDYTTDTSELADSVPVSQSLMPGADDAFADASAEPTFIWEESPAGSDEAGFTLDTDLGLDLDLGELDLSGLDLTEMPATLERSDDAGAEAAYDDPKLAEPVRFSSFGQDQVEPGLGDLDAEVAELAAHLEAFEKNDQRFAAAEPAFAATPKAAPREAPGPAAVAEMVVAQAVVTAPAARAEVSFDFSNLALAPMDGEVAPARIVPEFPAASTTKPPPKPVPAEPAPAGLGAVLVLAGLGGPDAVRQLLSSLPEQLAVPVILYQHLEVGKHERLVEQLTKISRLPVVLAHDGAVPAAGQVTLLPAGMTATAQGSSLVFGSGALSQLIAALPARESMIVVLSGAEVQLVPSILSVRDAGGLVLAQDPEVCFDATAAEAMQREGAAVYPALGLARQIAARWSL